MVGEDACYVRSDVADETTAGDLLASVPPSFVEEFHRAQNTFTGSDSTPDSLRQAGVGGTVPDVGIENMDLNNLDLIRQIVGPKNHVTDHNSPNYGASAGGGPLSPLAPLTYVLDFPCVCGHRWTQFCCCFYYLDCAQSIIVLLF